MTRADPLTALHHAHVDHVGHGCGRRDVQTNADPEDIVVTLLQLVGRLEGMTSDVGDGGAREYKGRLHYEDVA